MLSSAHLPPASKTTELPTTATASMMTTTDPHTPSSRSMGALREERGQASSTALYTVHQGTHGNGTLVAASSPEKIKGLDGAHVERFSADGFSIEPLQYQPKSPRKSVDPHMVFEGGIPDNLRKDLFDHAVRLERVLLRYPLAHCFVRVLDIAFEKRVFARVTSDNWATHADLDAAYVQEEGAGSSTSSFSVILRVPPGSTCLEFAICYQVDGKEYWDNCDGKNYRVQVEQHPSSPSSPDRTSAPSSAFASAASVHIPTHTHSGEALGDRTNRNGTTHGTQLPVQKQVGKQHQQQQQQQQQHSQGHPGGVSAGTAVTAKAIQERASQQARGSSGSRSGKGLISLV